MNLKISDYSGRSSIVALDEALVSVHSSLSKELNDTYQELTRPTSTKAISLLFLLSGLSLTFAIRELCAKGYLLSAEILLRPIIERIAVQNFLNNGGQESLQKWLQGNHPQTNKLLHNLLPNPNQESKKIVYDGMQWFHKHVHPDPLGATWHAERDEELGLIFSSSINTNSTSRCDLICAHARTLIEVLANRVLLNTSRFNTHQTYSSIDFPIDPYSNRKSIQVLDSIMNVAFIIDNNCARQTYKQNLKPLQIAATLLLPHSLSVIMGIRQLINVAHLVSAYMLLRPVLERIVLLCYLERKGEIEIQKCLRGELRVKIETMMNYLPQDFGNHPFNGIIEELHNLISATPKSIFMSMRVSDGLNISSTLSQVTAPDYCDSVAELTSFLLIYYGYISRKCFPDIVNEEIITKMVASVSNIGYQMAQH
jgi:hypothetical protein